MDTAAQNIAGKLIEKYGFRETESRSNVAALYRKNDFLLSYIQTDGIHTSWAGNLLEVEGVVVASRHRSEKGKPTLTVHAPGNPTSKAQYGGRPEELAWAWPERMRNALRKLDETKNGLSINYEVSLEATHHGPTQLNVPVWFVEIGGLEKYWKDPPWLKPSGHH